MSLKLESGFTMHLRFCIALLSLTLESRISITFFLYIHKGLNSAHLPLNITMIMKLRAYIYFNNFQNFLSS